MPVHKAVRKAIAIVKAAQILADALRDTPIHLHSDASAWTPKRGDRVQVRADHAWAGLPACPFTVVEVVGHGTNAMVSLTAAAGSTFKWFRATEVQLEEQMATIETALKRIGDQHRLDLTKDTGQAAKHLTDSDLTDYKREFNIAGENDPVEEEEPQYMLDGRMFSLSTVPALKKCTTFAEAVTVFRRETGADAVEGYRGAARLRGDLADAR